MFIIFLNNSMIDVSLYYCVYSRDCEPIIATLATTFLVRSTSKAPNFTIRMCVLSIVLILYTYIHVFLRIEKVVVEDTGYDRGRA